MFFFFFMLVLNILLTSDTFHSKIQWTIIPPHLTDLNVLMYFVFFICL